VSLSAVLDRRPIVVALAGPNGAGKSTFYEAYLAQTGLYFVNADVIALSLGIDAYEAARLANELRNRLFEQHESFIFETVLSDPIGEKVGFLADARHSGYTAVLIFIGLAGPELSDTRVAMRAASGGHDVPTQKLIERFPRTLNNLKLALATVPKVLVYDHSDLERGYRLIATLQEGQKIDLVEPVPDWLRSLLPGAK